MHSSDSHPLYFSSPEFGCNPATNVQAKTKFWLKDSKYSLYDMFGVEEVNVRTIVDKYFVGGTVYHAFLDPWCYHRWHSPVSGRLVKLYKLQGAYFKCN